MENSNSVKRVTRSQSRTAGGATTKPVPATPVSLKKATPATGRRSRKALADVTNDSPVAGLTPLVGSTRGGGDLTPNCSQLCPPLESAQGTPGDEVLRAHCINMLQQAGGDHFKPLRPIPSLLSQFTDSPTMLAAPTPANTPANVVWPPTSVPGSGGTLPASYMVSPAISEEESPVVVLPENPSSTLDVNWSFVPLRSPKSSPVEENISQSDRVDVLPIHVAEIVVPLKNGSPVLVVDLSISADSTPRTLDFDSPEKYTSRASPKVYTRRFSNLAAEKALNDQMHSTPTIKSGMADFDDDRWSVDVNVHSPPADSLPNDTADDLSSFTQLDGDLTDFDEGSKVPAGEFVTNSLEIEDEGIQLAGEPELVSTPLVANSNFVKFRLKREGDGQGKVDRLDTPFVWQRRDSTTDGHFVEFDNEDECDEDDWADCEEEYDEEEDCDDFNEVDCCDELCRGISHISMGGEQLKGLPAFTGTHTRFHYDSDGQVEEEVVRTANSAADTLSPRVTRLKGLPTPQGRHLRFESLSD